MKIEAPWVAAIAAIVIAIGTMIKIFKDDGNPITASGNNNIVVIQGNEEIAVDFSTAPASEEPKNKDNEYAANIAAPVPAPPHDFAVCIMNENNQSHANISRAVVGLIQRQGMSATTAFPCPTFSFSRLDENAMQGATNEISSELVKYADKAIFGKITESFLESPTLGDLVTATVSLTMYLMSLHTKTSYPILVIPERGAGFSRGDAVRRAEENIIEKLDAEMPALINKQ